MAETAYYSSTAWNPGRDEKPRRRGQLDTRSRNFRFQWAAGQKLPKSYVPDLVPSSFLRTWHAKDVDADVEMGVGNAQRLRNEGKCDKPVGWIDQESIRYATLPSSSWRWLIVKAFAKFLSTIGALVFTIICISMLITVEDDWRSLLQEFYIPVMFYGGGTSVLIWGIISLIERLFPRWIYKDPKVLSGNSTVALAWSQPFVTQRRNGTPARWPGNPRFLNLMVTSTAVPPTRACRCITGLWSTDTGKRR